VPVGRCIAESPWLAAGKERTWRTLQQGVPGWKPLMQMTVGVECGQLLSALCRWRSFQAASPSFECGRSAKCVGSCSDVRSGWKSDILRRCENQELWRAPSGRVLRARARGAEGVLAHSGNAPSRAVFDSGYRKQGQPVTGAWVAGSYSDNGYDKTGGPWLATQDRPSLAAQSGNALFHALFPITVIRNKERPPMHWSGAKVLTGKSGRACPRGPGAKQVAEDGLEGNDGPCA
jgi:hypothetical protein